MTVAVRSFECSQATPTAARRWVQGRLEEWRVCRQKIGDVLIAVSELCANAVMHAQSEFTVVLRLDRDVVGIAVTDGDARLPELLPPSSERVGGRGVRMLDRVASRWGSHRIPRDGKVVWAVLPAN
jgi:anti-sigma regulatory factor (Ser/Thr protein kinase)